MKTSYVIPYYDYKITKLLNKYSIPLTILDSYKESHRFYHGIDHINSMIHGAIEKNILDDKLFLAILFHDIIYNPKNNNNEELSAELLYKYVKDNDIKQAILDTKKHSHHSNELSKNLSDLDLDILWSDYSSFIDYEEKIFKEYQWVDYEIYKINRTKLLYELGVDKIKIDYVNNRKPKIGVYAGSFNPFHKGHLNILEKAERIFDKVIIARGINPDKNNNIIKLPEQIKFRQIEYYDGLLTDFINTLKYDATLIRGLRNSNDLQYEVTQYRFLQELKPNINVVSIFCDSKYEHISSSAIRILSKYGKGDNYLI